MDEQTPEPAEVGLGNQLYIILGAILLVVIIGAWYFLRQKSEPFQQTSVTAPIVPTPTPGPVTGLACENQYYNPVIGFPQYYISAEGVDLPGSKKIDCVMKMSVEGHPVGTATISSPLTPLPQRGGDSFRCTTQKVELTPGVSTVVDVAVNNDRGQTASCSATFILPSP